MTRPSCCIDRQIDKKNDYLISIIVPTYNSIKKMNRLLASIRKQNYLKYEIIFVDDGSTDETYNYLRNYSKYNNKMHVYRKDHGGPGLARRLGFEKSTGDLLLFLDSDDWLFDSDTLGRINNVFLMNELAGICLCNRITFPSEEIIGPFAEGTIQYGLHGLNVFFGLSIVGNMSTKVFRRDVLSSKAFIGSFNFEDLATSYVGLDHCKKIIYINDCFYVSNRSKNRGSLTADKNYKEKTVLERVENLINAFSLVKNAPIRSSLGSVIFGTYCYFVEHRMIGRKYQSSLKKMKRIIRRLDLRGFYPGYSFKKRLVLRFIKLRLL